MHGSSSIFYMGDSVSLISNSINLDLVPNSNFWYCIHLKRRHFIFTILLTGHTRWLIIRALAAASSRLKGYPAIPHLLETQVITYEILWDWKRVPFQPENETFKQSPWPNLSRRLQTPKPLLPIKKTRYNSRTSNRISNRQPNPQNDNPRPNNQWRKNSHCPW